MVYLRTPEVLLDFLEEEEEEEEEEEGGGGGGGGGGRKKEEERRKKKKKKKVLGGSVKAVRVTYCKEKNAGKHRQHAEKSVIYLSLKTDKRPERNKSSCTAVPEPRASCAALHKENVQVLRLKLTNTSLVQI